MAQKNYVIPIFIPHSGCPFQCIFCDQKQITGTVQMPDPQTVCDTIETYLKTIPKTARRIMLAFYGGNFTGLKSDTQKNYLQAVQPYLISKKIAAIRISTRPDCIDRDTLLRLREHGVTEIELGIQSFDDNVLEQSQRGYDAATAVRASIMIREYGFALGHQFMIGLPGDSWQALITTAQTSARVYPDMIRIYPTLVIRNTPLARLESFSPLSLDEAIKRSAFLIDFFEQRHVRILRVGLHPPQDEGSIVSGPFHPAFRYLVYSYIWRDFFLKTINFEMLKQVVRLTLSSDDLSYVVGYKAKNRKIFHPTSSASIRPDPSSASLIRRVPWLLPGHVLLGTADGGVIHLNRNAFRITNTDTSIKHYSAKEGTH